MQLTNFQEALKNLGANDDERGRAIGVDDRTIRWWRAREPRILRIIASHPALAQALVADAQRLLEEADPTEIAA
jgi:hypothetical protein